MVPGTMELMVSRGSVGELRIGSQDLGGWGLGCGGRGGGEGYCLGSGVWICFFLIYGMNMGLTRGTGVRQSKETISSDKNSVRSWADYLEKMVRGG